MGFRSWYLAGLVSLALAAVVMDTAWAAERVRVEGESLVLAGTMPGTLCFADVDAVTVRSTYDAQHPDAIVYEAGRDYDVDQAAGTISRTEDSRIPDYATNVLYGQKEFDHTKFPGYGNLPFFVWVDYETAAGFPLVDTKDQRERLAQTRSRLEAGRPFKLMIYGDSISTGGEASAERYQFGHRYADWLRAKFPKADIVVENGATGGDSTVQGLNRLEEKVLTREPDLVLLGFGMNDHNKGSLEPEVFEANVIAIIEAIRSKTGADVLVHSAFPPNPDWMHSSHRMVLFAAASARAAEATHCAYADVYGVWDKVLARKDLPSLLANNINHPNDWGHWLYFQALSSVGF
jgi:lysophospholipase L1-like esterase